MRCRRPRPHFLRFCHAVMTQAFRLRLTNFTMIGRGFATTTVCSSSDWVLSSTTVPTRCESLIPSSASGGRNLRALLHRSSSMASVELGVLSGTPNTLTEARRLCCSRSSLCTRRSFTSRLRVTIMSTFFLILDCRAITACFQGTSVVDLGWIPGSPVPGYRLGSRESVRLGRFH